MTLVKECLGAIWDHHMRSQVPGSEIRLRTDRKVRKKAHFTGRIHFGRIPFRFVGKVDFETLIFETCFFQSQFGLLSHFRIWKEGLGQSTHTR